MRRIFICYRRNESEHAAGALGRDLRARYGPERVFRDKEDIAGGESWKRKVLSEIDRDAALLVLVTRDWAECRDDQGRRRLERDDDPIRMELADGLRDRATVIPLLVEAAPMPRADQLPEDLREFAELNALQLRDGDWAHDLAKLYATLEAAGFKPLVPSVGSPWSASFISTCVMAALTATAVVADRSDWDGETYSGFVILGVIALIVSIVALRDHKRRNVRPTWLAKAAVTLCSLTLIAAIGIQAEAEELGLIDDDEIQASELVPSLSGAWLDQFGSQFTLSQDGPSVSGQVLTGGELLSCSGAVSAGQLGLTLWRNGFAAGEFQLALSPDGQALSGQFFGPQREHMEVALRRR